MKRNKHLTKNMHRILSWMRENDPDDQLTNFIPGGWWIGEYRVSGATCFNLLRLCLISAENESATCVYYGLNEDGEKILDDINYVPRIVRELLSLQAD